MSYLVVVTFDIKEGDPDDYNVVYEGLEKIGLKRKIKPDQGEALTLPTTTTAGKIDGASAAAVRDDICTKAKAVFTDNKLNGEIFVSVGGDWAWGHRTA